MCLEDERNGSRVGVRGCHRLTTTARTANATHGCVRTGRNQSGQSSAECSFTEQRRRRLKAFLPQIAVPAPADVQLDGLLRTYLADYEAAWRAYPDVVPCLETLSDVLTR